MTTPAKTPRLVTRTASANLTRLVCITVAYGAGIFGLLSIGPFLAQLQHPNPAVATLAWAFSFGLPVALGVCAGWGCRPRLSAAIAAAMAVCFVLVAGLWLLVPGQPLPAGADIPWSITFTGVPCVAVAVFARRWLAWSFTVLACLLSGAVRFSTSAAANPGLIGLADGLYSLLLVSVFVALTLAARRGAARVDAATLLTRQAGTRRAARLARRRERLRVDALVHDSVLSTLLMAGLGRTPPTVVSEHAAKTLAQLDAFRSPPVQPVVLVAEVVQRLRRLTRQIAPDAVLTVDGPAPSDGSPARTVPAVAVAALLGAAGEALRNSVASAAGPGRPDLRRVRRSVRVLSTTESFQVTVSDDGVGFDPGGVPPERLGIAESIVGRMGRAPHGTATVRSSPGTGTDVVLAWTPARGPAPHSTGPGVERRAARRHPEPAEHDDAHPVSLARSLDLSVPVARLILALFLLVHGLLAAIDIVPGRPVLLVVAAYLALAFAGVIVVGPVDGAFPRRRVAGVLGLCGLGAGLMFGYLPADSGAPFAHWHLGAITLILVVLAARRRIGAAWLGYTLMALLTVAWAVWSGKPALAGLELVSRHAGTLLAGTLTVLSLNRTEATLRVLTHRDTAQAAHDATTVAAIDEREAELMRVNQLARPTLHRLATPHPLTAAERARCLLVEASLRDAIRGRALFVEPVITAVCAARQRGVQVTLIDDSADSPPAELTALARTVAHALDGVEHGRVTVRVLPAGRTDAATLVIESGTPRILTLDPAGTVRSPGLPAAGSADGKATSPPAGHSA